MLYKEKTKKHATDETTWKDLVLIFVWIWKFSEILVVVAVGD